MNAQGTVYIYLHLKNEIKKDILHPKAVIRVNTKCKVGLPHIISKTNVNLGQVFLGIKNIINKIKITNQK
jgi:hypothetical protein